jgi:hypothetical protein
MYIARRILAAILTLVGNGYPNLPKPSALRVEVTEIS